MEEDPHLNFKFFCRAIFARFFSKFPSLLSTTYYCLMSNPFLFPKTSVYICFFLGVSFSSIFQGFFIFLMLTAKVQTNAKMQNASKCENVRIFLLGAKLGATCVPLVNTLKN